MPNLTARPQVFDRDTVSASVVVRPMLTGWWGISTEEGFYMPRATEAGAIEAARTIYHAECDAHGLGRVLLAVDYDGDEYADVTQVSK